MPAPLIIAVLRNCCKFLWDARIGIVPPHTEHAFALDFCAVLCYSLTGDPAVYVMQSNALSQHFVGRELISEGAENVLAVMVAAQLDDDGRGLAITDR